MVWYTGKSGAAGVFYARQGAGGAVALIQRKTPPPGHVSVAALPDGGALAAYDVDGDGKRAATVARIAAAGRIVSQLSVPRSKGGTYPQVVTAGAAGALVDVLLSGGAISSSEMARRPRTRGSGAENTLQTSRISFFEHQNEP